MTEKINTKQVVFEDFAEKLLEAKTESRSYGDNYSLTCAIEMVFSYCEIDKELSNVSRWTIHELIIKSNSNVELLATSLYMQAIHHLRINNN